jgi:uncharacterized protein YkwD
MNLPTRPMIRMSLIAAAVLVTSVALTAPVAAAQTTRIATTTESTAQSGLLTLITGARAELGLRPLRSDSRLGSLAVKRAAFMAGTGVLSHTTYGGDIGSAVNATGVPWLALGEAVAKSSTATGASTASVLFNIWKNSPPHWALITSEQFNYIGIGVALTAGGAPFGALVFAETADRTAPVVSVTSGARSGRNVTWRWKGSDVLLQTHTAGFCSFDVAYRVDSGAWKVLRTRSTTTSMTLASRPAGHAYSVRILGRDCAGNLSAWSAAKAVRV